MSIVSPKAKPTACDTCRRLNIQCNLDNYIDDCERCTSLGERCFITDDYNITIHKVPQRTLHNLNSTEVIYQLGALGMELHNKQSDGKNTHAIVDAFVSKFEGISEEAINYPEVQGFLAYHLSGLIMWFKNNPDHQVWNVALYDQKTRQSLKKLSDILKSLQYPRYSNSASCFAWLLNTIDSEGQNPSDSLSDNHNQAHTTSSDPANEPERRLSADIQAGESQAGESQARESQAESLQAGDLQAGDLQAGDLQAGDSQAGEL
ncbi:uncharacterized protein Bfra_004357 [Botrytis fragariae]|uniref:Zn(2)-C6 fungal-type domain-containing protein n=1 Tax=Botrytis fragariae TaxID=1964551 RepID=A0A8H6EJB3_9HELO|nr:uncharacterized protein Bfra_004357 [Botrytis fragariae]KAF5874351.1 hypothetical protein Bfra_004357 [Botrytis fragariae]